MPRNISWRKAVKKFKRLGFTGPHPGGRHLFMEKDGHSVHIPNPHEGDISRGLMAEILHKAEIENDDWENA